MYDRDSNKLWIKLQMVQPRALLLQILPNYFISYCQFDTSFCSMVYGVLEYFVFFKEYPFT